MSEPISPADISPQLAAATRDWAQVLCLWRLCGKARCRRAQACRGDVRVCFRAGFALLPEGVRDWFIGLGEAQAEGLSFDEAMEQLDDSDAGDAFRDWHDQVAVSLGQEPGLPAEWWRVRG